MSQIATPTSRLAHAKAGTSIFATLLICTTLTAQPTSDSTIGRDQFQRVEQGRGDQGPLDKSLLSISRELRVPNDFSGVYQISPEANSRYAGRFARVSGGIIAVFPRSVYVNTRSGVRAPVPPGTEFFIGGVPTRSMAPTAPSPLSVPTQMPSARIDSAVEREPSPPRSEPARPVSSTNFDRSSDSLSQPAELIPRTLGISALGQPIEAEIYIRSTNRIMTDGQYRGQRLTQLLTLAYDQGQRLAPSASSGTTPGSTPSPGPAPASAPAR